MDNNKQLCQKLLNAESEAEVVSLLKKHGYWDNSACWRYYGDSENNWGQGGNQQSQPEAALAEKIVNSVDARLINECRVHGIEPDGGSAPKTIREAVARFFEGNTGEQISTAGNIQDWGQRKIRETADGITLTATGIRPKGLNITVSDCGEGQTPDNMPFTLLSLSKSNKQLIPFVQGQFNQGGTGVLRFCGENHLQLIITRRNQHFVQNNTTERDLHWGFTVVRRELPDDNPSGRKNSVYTYLAPEGEDVNRDGQVLSFAADSFPIFPGEDLPYERNATHGTAIKMYDYKFRGDRSNILRGSLLSRLDIRLPELALPVRMHEFRKDRKGDYLGHGSRSTSLSGLLRRIKDSENVETGFPISCPFTAHGEELTANIYAFVKARSGLGGIKNYRKSEEGVVFLCEGQTQGCLSVNFLRSDKMKMKPLAGDLLVFIECNKISRKNREELFMPSRDRLADTKFRKEIIDSLVSVIRDSPELNKLRNTRQQEMLKEALEDNKPFAEVLKSIIHRSPTLKSLLELGDRIPEPFNTTGTGSEISTTFEGKYFPTFFKLKGIPYDEVLVRTCPINRRMRLTFETDACNDFFTRKNDPGQFNFEITNEKYGVNLTGPNLNNGIATVNVKLPEDITVGTTLDCVSQTIDVNNTFTNSIKVTVTKPDKRQGGGGGGGRDNPSEEGGIERERPRFLDTPRIKKVYKEDWDEHDFDKETAMKIEPAGFANGDQAEIYLFKINMDNVYLLNERKIRSQTDEEHRLLAQQYMYANVLIGLALLAEDKQKNNPEVEIDSTNEPIEQKVESTCRALAPFIPALISLGTEVLDLDDGDDGD